MLMVKLSLKVGFHMIADDRGSRITKSSAIVCDLMETHFCDRLTTKDLVQIYIPRVP